MPITVNTNMSSLVAQSNLNKATKSLNQAIERMTTGYKINSAADNAANYSIAKNWEVKLSSLDVAADNIATGTDLLSTLEDNCDLVSTHLQRIRDLTEQAANGTYGDDSRAAIQSEIQARMDEITRIQANCEYNGINLMNSTGTEMKLQVGIGSDGNNQITIDATLTAALSVTFTAAKCASATDAAGELTKIDTALNSLNTRVTSVGALQNRLESAADAVNVQSENITSSLSTIKDADVAEESSKYVQAQILQQAAATLLATANQQPSIALSLM